GRQILTADADLVRAWDVTSGRLVAGISRPRPLAAGRPGDGPSRVALSPDGRTFLTAEGRSARLRGLDPDTKSPILEHEEDVLHAAFSGDGRCVLTVAGPTARVWD